MTGTFSRLWLFVVWYAGVGARRGTPVERGLTRSFVAELQFFCFCRTLYCFCLQANPLSLCRCYTRRSGSARQGVFSTQVCGSVSIFTSSCSNDSILRLNLFHARDSQHIIYTCTCTFSQEPSSNLLWRRCKVIFSALRRRSTLVGYWL